MMYIQNRNNFFLIIQIKERSMVSIRGHTIIEVHYYGIVDGPIDFVLYDNEFKIIKNINIKKQV